MASRETDQARAKRADDVRQRKSPRVEAGRAAGPPAKGRGRAEKEDARPRKDSKRAGIMRMKPARKQQDSMEEETAWETRRAASLERREARRQRREARPCAGPQAGGQPGRRRERDGDRAFDRAL